MKIDDLHAGHLRAAGLAWSAAVSRDANIWGTIYVMLLEVTLFTLRCLGDLDKRVC